MGYINGGHCQQQNKTIQFACCRASSAIVLVFERMWLVPPIVDDLSLLCSVIAVIAEVVSLMCCAHSVVFISNTPVVSVDSNEALQS